MYWSKCSVAIGEICTEDTEQKALCGSPGHVTKVQPSPALYPCMKRVFWPWLFAATYVCLRHAARSALALPSCAAYVT